MLPDIYSKWVTRPTSSAEDPLRGRSSTLRDRLAVLARSARSSWAKAPFVAFFAGL